jgi:hypothetical protein
MGFILTIFYLVVSYLTPVALFGQLAVFRIELILAAVAFLVSLPALTKSFILKSPQSLSLIGLALAVFLSVLILLRWPGGAVQSLLGFLPSAFAYFLVCLHCDSKKKLKVLVFMLLFVCLFVIAHGYIDLLRGVPASATVLPGEAVNVPLRSGATASPYLLRSMTSQVDWYYRLMGEGEIHDPNDFGQLIACVIPLMFIFWRPKKALRNFVLVLLPVCALLFGVYMTHSRGALLALVAMVLVASRRRIGTLPALLIAGGVLAAAMALNFTGGRDISVDAGQDRTVLWGESLQILKSHPMFGVGFGKMGDYTDSHLTAHNSIAVCAAETGVFGLFFWSMFLFPMVRDALTVASPAKVSEGEPIKPEEGLFPRATGTIEAVDKAEINRLGRLLVLSLTGFLVAAWFLSRAFVMTFFLLGGMVEVVYQMALQRGMIAPRMRLARLLRYASGLAILLVIGLYITIRIMNRMH